MNIRDRKVNENIGLVHACAKRFRGRGIDYDDLVQSGCIGLIKAVDAFDDDRGVQFSTYAVPVILGEMKKLFRDGGAVKIGRSLKELSLKATRECEKFRANEGREPTIGELASILGVETVQAAQALSASMSPISLNATDDDGVERINISVESHDEKISNRIALKQIVSQLEAKDRSIITLRFFKGQTQTQTAHVLGMTQVQVSRREKVILKQLRAKLE